MKEFKKKPLTFWTCFRSYPWWHLMIARILIGIPTILIIMAIVGVMSGEITSVRYFKLNIFEWVILIFMFIVMFWIGLELLFNTFKFLIAITRKQYFIYIAVVSDKRIGFEEFIDSCGVGCGVRTTYYLQFKKNRYKKPVSKKEYDIAPIGTPYYLVKIIGANKAFAAFAESKYYLHKSVQNQFKQVDKNEFN